MQLGGGKPVEQLLQQLHHLPGMSCLQLIHQPGMEFVKKGALQSLRTGLDILNMKNGATAGIKGMHQRGQRVFIGVLQFTYAGAGSADANGSVQPQILVNAANDLFTEA
ncbi:hypothetical protein D3C75_922000 [compost metagenome]